MVESVNSQNNAFNSVKEFTKEWLFKEVVSDGHHATVQILKQRQRVIMDTFRAKKEGIADFLLKFVVIEDVAVSVNILDTVYSVTP